jgi:dUTP pyrophosphatase
MKSLLRFLQMDTQLLGFKLKYKFCRENKYPPTKAHGGDAGYDLCAAEYCEIPAGGKAIVKTGLILVIPTGHYGRVAPRSSVAWKFHSDVGAGVIDSIYREEVGVVIFNHGNSVMKFNPGDRVAQIIIERYLDLETEEVDSFETTERTGGFGSTGVTLAELQKNVSSTNG